MTIWNFGQLGQLGQQGGDAQPNPMQQMMQQMMSNPAMMQQAMAMSQQMMPQAHAQGNAAPFSGLGGGAGGFGSPPAGVNPFQMMMQQMNSGGVPAQGTGESPPIPESAQRMRFASQLMQLANMGFTDESTCLRALAQHNGRLDSAIDVLLTGTVE